MEETDDCLAKNWSRTTREADHRKHPLKEDNEHLRRQKELFIGTLDTRLSNRN